jgi:hypothetical protein
MDPVRLPFADFERAAAQPDGAPDDEALLRGEVWSVGIQVGGGPGSAMLDEVRWYVALVGRCLVVLVRLWRRASRWHPSFSAVVLAVAGGAAPLPAPVTA